MTDEDIAFSVYNSKVGKGGVYLISVCGSVLLKLIQGGRYLKAGFRDSHGSGGHQLGLLLSWMH